MKELGKMKQETLEKKLLNLPLGILNTRSIASIYMAWMAEQIANSTSWNDPSPVWKICGYLQGKNCSGVLALQIWNEMLLEARMEHNMEDPWTARIHDRGPLVEKIIIQLLVPDLSQRYPVGNANKKNANRGNANKGMLAKEQTNLRDPNPPHFHLQSPFSHPILTPVSPYHPAVFLPSACPPCLPIHRPLDSFASRVICVCIYSYAHHLAIFPPSASFFSCVIKCVNVYSYTQHPAVFPPSACPPCPPCPPIFRPRDSFASCEICVYVHPYTYPIPPPAQKPTST